MLPTAFFRFFFTLNDFLSPANKNQLVKYELKGNPAIKDAIEAIGIPHPEVDYIEANGSPVDFFYKLNNSDEVDVYPLNADRSITKGRSLTPKHTYPLAFIADVNLGKLAKALRILGIDTKYTNHYCDKTVALLAEKENRIVLTRDIGLLKHKSIKWGYWLRSQKVEKQLEEVLQLFNLFADTMPFKRCLACNGLIEPASKEIVLDGLPPKTIEYFDEFFQCSCCKKVYWKGSHYENMLKWINNFKTQKP
jgi:uncharacterized protein with PIN domain